MSNKFDWKALAEIATLLSNGYSLCSKCGTMWLANESLPCPKCLIGSAKVKAEKTETIGAPNGS